MIVFGIFALDYIIIMTKIERKYEISQKKFNSGISRNLFDIYRRFFFSSQEQADEEFRSVSQSQVWTRNLCWEMRMHKLFCILIIFKFLIILYW